jgi:hypothetical protein
MKPFFKFAMLALVLVAVALVSALTAMRFAIHGQVVEVPVVVGLTPLEAERSVAGLGLQIEVERQYSAPSAGDEGAARMASTGGAEHGAAARGDSGCDEAK